jgi:hypothetical protein
MPEALGAEFITAWQLSLRAQMAEKSKGRSPDWSPPSNWQTVWPDTRATDVCGEWVEKG